MAFGSLDLVSGIAVLLTVLIPGELMALALLKGVKFSKWEKALIGLALGVLIPPLLLTLEATFLQIPLNGATVLGNYALIAVASAIALFAQGFNFNLRLPKFELEQDYDKAIDFVFKNWVPLAILVIMLSGFYARFATAWAYNFFEFDPIYYDHLTEMLVKNGAIPMNSDQVYYPLPKWHHQPPLTAYITGSWYSLYTYFGNFAFDKETMVSIIQVYPPLMGALLCFLAYLLVKEEYGEGFGVIAAVLFAATPQLVMKMGAGVSETQPLSLFVALLLFAFFAIAYKRRSARLAGIAALAGVSLGLATAQAVWPIMILALFLVIESFTSYLEGHEDKLLVAKALVVAGAFAGAVANSYYAGMGFLIPNSIQMLFAGLGVSVFFAVYSKLEFSKDNPKWVGVAVLGLALLLLGILTPIGSKAVSYFNGFAAFSQAGAPILKTVQEEAPATTGFFQSAYGVLNPPVLLGLLSVVVSLVAIVKLFKEGGKNGRAAAIAVSAMLVVIIFLNSLLDEYVIKPVAGFLFAGSPELLNFIISGDVFLQFLLVVVAVSAYSLVLKKNDLAIPLFLAVVIMPTAYIGLNKLKYMVHLAFNLALLLPVLLGEANRLTVTTFPGIESRRRGKFVAFGLLALGGIMALVQAFGILGQDNPWTVKHSMNSLQASRITDDWMKTMDWMRLNTEKDARFISWWDYGHWTTFFGERKSVLDPGNNYVQFDHETAHAFVDGPPSELIGVMKEHDAQYVMLDAELVPKWGALTYLSGTYNGTNNNFNPGITDWTKGPGFSNYEFQHYFESVYMLLQSTGQGFQPLACPTENPQQILSYIGELSQQIYCKDAKDNFFIVTKDRKLKALPDVKMIPYAQPQGVTELGNTGIYRTAIPQYYNLNPPLKEVTNGELESKLFQSNFVQLYFFESLPGFQLAYKSPNGQVKIFKLVQ